MFCSIRTIAAIFIAAVLSVAALSADTQSEAILSKLSSKVKSMDPYKVEFTATVEGRSVSGEYRVDGARYYMKVDGGEVVCDGRDRYEINHANREVVIDRVSPDDRNILSNPVKAFDFAADMFTSAYGGTTSVVGKSCDVVSLRPKRKSTLTGVTVYIDRDGGLPVTLKYEADGIDGEVEVSVRSFVTDRSGNRAHYTFDPARYPGYEMVDFR